MTPTAPTGVRRPTLLYRPHLDGLRTVAVYLVLAFHAGLSGFRGGFVGVDVFFVLSGFLVTSILLRDLAATDRVDFGRFYVSRVRRILPAAIITLCVTAIAYAVVATPSEMLDVLGGFRASCLYVANWFFIRQSTDYFASNVNASPVLHFWSLAVEEQFYLLWPLLLGGLYLATRRARRQWWVLRGLVLAAAVASAAEAWRIAGSNLERAYYGTDTRAYQLLAGALLALTPQLMRAGPRVVKHMAWLVTLLLAGLVIVASSAVDAGPITRGILAAGLATLLIVGLENSRGGLVKELLSSRPTAYLGRLSYGTYLWHWPIIVIAVHGRHVDSLTLFVMTCAGATGLAALSHHLVEQPLRASHVIERYKRLAIGLGVAASVAVGLAFMPSVLDSTHSTSGNATAGTLLDWRAARSDIAKLPDCLGRSVERCTAVHGTGQRVLLIGDSHAQMWLPALEAIAKKESLTLSVAVLDACPWQRGMLYLGSGSLSRNCKRHQADWYDRVVPTFDPDIVVLAQSGSGNASFAIPFTFPDGKKLAFGQAGYDEALNNASAATVEMLRAQHRRVVIFEPIPVTFPFDPLSCLSRGVAPQDCTDKVDAR
ncbi:MAG: hypothetical protein QOG65_886, partial [Actinomycetota bacterium]|nr:hypothetical protein [Actinomycetota bacterium]